jgi:hypothetical protein
MRAVTMASKTASIRPINRLKPKSTIDNPLCNFIRLFHTYDKAGGCGPPIHEGDASEQKVVVVIQR